MRARIGWELALVLGVSLGKSAVYSVLSIIDRLTRSEPLARQTSTLNQSVTADRPWLDLAYQLFNIAFALVPVLLALHLLSDSFVKSGRLIGFDLRRPRFDLGLGALIAAGIGVPGLGLYLGARELGLNTEVQASGLNDYWWTVPVLVLAAAHNALLEQVVMIGYFYNRTAQLRWSVPLMVLTSALIRGSYHLYQGFGGFVGNLIMGAIFGLIYLRVRRLWPLVVAHTLLDVSAFVGYALLATRVSWL